MLADAQREQHPASYAAGGRVGDRVVGHEHHGAAAAAGSCLDEHGAPVQAPRRGDAAAVLEVGELGVGEDRGDPLGLSVGEHHSHLEVVTLRDGLAAGPGEREQREAREQVGLPAQRCPQGVAGGVGEQRRGEGAGEQRGDRGRGRHRQAQAGGEAHPRSAPVTR